MFPQGNNRQAVLTSHVTSLKRGVTSFSYCNVMELRRGTRSVAAGLGGGPGSKEHVLSCHIPSRRSGCSQIKKSAPCQGPSQSASSTPPLLEPWGRVGLKLPHQPVFPLHSHPSEGGLDQDKEDPPRQPGHSC